ncbi:MAG: UPF0149 family protein [Gemmatimonas sp.]|jgi:uncharacterized protein
MPDLSRRGQLEDELLALGENVMLIEELDGLIAGLSVCPELIKPGEWLPVVWGLDKENGQSAFDDLDHANRVLKLVMDYYNDVVLTLMRNTERYRPLFPIDRRNGDILWEIWIEGFAEAVRLRPAAWKKLLDAGDETAIAIGGLLMLVDVVHRDHELTEEELAKLTNAAPKLIPQWIVTLNNWRLANTQPAPIPAARPMSARAPYGKVGRNEPCPCGSGKKYKRCCGLN